MLDLAPFLFDPNDLISNIHINATRSDFKVEGHNLSTRLGRWIDDFLLELCLTDGESSSTSNLMIHIISVNDLPVIVSIGPVNGTVFGKAQPVKFNVTVFDEDGDAITIEWTEGGRTVGLGQQFTIDDLAPGRHIITAHVSDGAAEVQRSVVIDIENNLWDTVGLSSIVALILIVTVVLGITHMVRHRKHI